MVYLQHKQVDEYLNHKSKTELSLETQVFLKFAVEHLKVSLNY